MLLRSGLLFAFIAVCLQIAVFLQPLLPKQYQVAPVCETITRALLSQPLQSKSINQTLHSTHVMASHHAEHMEDQHMSGHAEHDANHQCQYCTVYGNLVLPPDLEVKEVLDRIQIRLITFQKTFSHVWFVLQRLFLIPQGRAPPLFA